MGRLADVVFDCRHPASLARFWAAALDGYEVAPYDEDELARLHAEGIDDPEDDPAVLVESQDPAQPRVWFQRVAEPKQVKNRVHVDVAAVDIEAEAARLVALGASRQADQRVPSRIVLADPEGNEFCVIR